jgi:hypothetical protein
MFWLTSAFSTIPHVWESGLKLHGHRIFSDCMEWQVFRAALSLALRLRLLPQTSISLSSSSGLPLRPFQPVSAIYNS